LPIGDFRLPIGQLREELIENPKLALGNRSAPGSRVVVLTRLLRRAFQTTPVPRPIAILAFKLE
jgi:hypothetical protein